MSEKQVIRVYVDERERASYVPRLLTKLGIYVVYKQLSIGDYLVSDEVIIERKTVEDLIRSTFDGRLFDQAKRMGEAYTTPILIVEGELSLIEKITSRRKQVLSALATVALDYGLKLFYTRSQDETAELISLIARRVQAPRPVRIVVHRKPKLSTLEEWQLYIVQSLPYVGPKTAYKLLEKFGTVERIFTASSAELSKIEGIGENKARMIVKIIKTPFTKGQQSKRILSLSDYVELHNE